MNAARPQRLLFDNFLQVHVFIVVRIAFNSVHSQIMTQFHSFSRWNPKIWCQGWDEGVATMSLGEKAKLQIPADLGYGARGAPGAIPPNSDLTFEVELLAIGEPDQGSGPCTVM